MRYSHADQTPYGATDLARLGRGPAHVALSAAPADMAAWIGPYRNDRIDARHWVGPIGDGIRSALAAIAAADPALAKKAAPVLCCVVAGALADGVCDPSAGPHWPALIHPHNVERSVTKAMAGLQPRTRATYRSLLRRVGPILAPDAPWQPAPLPISPKSAPKPYSDAELAALWQGIDSAPTPFRWRVEMFAVVGLGIGVIEPCVWDLTTRDVTGDTIGSVIAVAGRRPRRVPLLHTYQGRFDALVARLPAGSTLLRTTGSSKNRTHKLLARINGPSCLVRLDPARMRSTWLCWHLRAGTPLLELTEAAGLESTKGLAGLLGYVPRLEPTRRRQVLHGLPPTP